MIYLDHLTTTPPLPEVVDAMQPWLREQFGAPAALHRPGLEARDAIDAARVCLAKLVNAAEPEEIIFTSSGTEAINHAVKGAALAKRRFGTHIVTTAIEHPAVLGSIAWLESQGFSSTQIGVDGEGRIDPAALGQAMTEETVLVCLHHASHDLGTIQPVAEVAKLTGARGIPLFVDTTASGGWLPVDVGQLGADLIALSPHRFGGPKGAGVLYRKSRVGVENLIHGGMQENERRAGTENVAAIVGAGVAAKQAGAALGQAAADAAKLQARLLDGIRGAVDGVQLNGPEPGDGRLPHQLSLSTEGVEGEGQALMLDLRGVAIAAGAACTTRSMRLPPALRAIGRDADLAKGTTLWSIGRDTTEDNVDRAIEQFAVVTAKLRALSPTN
ncbi:MAG: cysteine desulfurase NifS [Verrucomicrobiales bacterium]|jgi:cysteine desulfurase|nr:cysteine desulfurase NifS [Verrucomicrobiales bacterium]MDP6677867.1 cysteine desulfurase family protein [Verrucomicrobiota bacterium]MDP6753258.1 cysteine desulfurase family protein [Verrucomicrobiota bacterium]MDP7012694.1 cysteine desulfurase family protein [Verrucomicrobiota bacterium]